MIKRFPPLNGNMYFVWYLVFFCHYCFQQVVITIKPIAIILLVLHCFCSFIIQLSSVSFLVWWMQFSCNNDGGDFPMACNIWIWKPANMSNIVRMNSLQPMKFEAKAHIIFDSALGKRFPRRETCPKRLFSSKSSVKPSNRQSFLSNASLHYIILNFL